MCYSRPSSSTALTRPRFRIHQLFITVSTFFFFFTFDSPLVSYQVDVGSTLQTGNIVDFSNFCFK